MGKSNSDLEGGIDFISTSKISGWVFSKKIKFSEVRMISNQELISRVEINGAREDIVRKFGVECTPGFSISLLNISKDIDLDNLSFIAMSFDGKHIIEISFLKEPEKNIKILEELLKSDLKGIDGHFDGITPNGILHGWAAKANQEKSVSIWLWSKDTLPVEVECNQEHGGLENLKINKKCGFVLDSNYLDEAWNDKEVWFTFDEKGEYKLPQTNIIKISRNLKKEIDNQNMRNNFFEEKVDQFIEDLNHIKEIKITLENKFIEKTNNIEELENELDIISSSIKNLNNLENEIKNRSFFNRVKNFLKFRKN